MMQFKFEDNPHSIVIGSAGSGKSSRIMADAQRITADPNAKVVVFDASSEGADQ